MNDNVVNICGVILAAGAGIRLGYPNELGGKPMVKVLEKPLLAYGLERLADVGIKDIALVVNPINKPVIEEFAGDGSNWGVNITYMVQEKPLGIAHALFLCKEFTGGRKILLLLVDNLFSANISGFINAYSKDMKDNAEIFTVPVNNPQDYGVAVMQNGNLINLIEKPQQFISNLAVIGLYLLPADVYDLIPMLKPSARGELEITDVNNLFLQQERLHCNELNGWWVDVGNADRLSEAERLMQKN